MGIMAADRLASPIGPKWTWSDGEPDPEGPGFSRDRLGYAQENNDLMSNVQWSISIRYETNEQINK